MPLDDAFAYFRGYDKRSFAVFSCHGNEPSETDVAAFESEAGFRLPEEFRAFTMSPLGGLYMEVREELWPRPKEFDVGPFWSFLYGLAVFGIATGIPDWLDIREQTRRFRTEGNTDLVPFFHCVGDADRCCFDSSGRIVRWSHEEPERRVAETMAFGDFLMREIRELEQRTDRKLRGGQG